MMIRKLRLQLSLAGLALALLCLGCARAPQKPEAWTAASEAAVRDLIRDNAQLYSRTGEIKTVTPGPVEWDRVQKSKLLFWRAPQHSRLASYRIESATGRHTINVLLQGRGDRAEVVYWEWMRR